MLGFPWALPILGAGCWVLDPEDPNGPFLLLESESGSYRVEEDWFCMPEGRPWLAPDPVLPAVRDAPAAVPLG